MDNNMKAEVYWFTGQPGAGKTVLGKRLKAHLDQIHPQDKHVLIDGDDVRELFENKDYSKEGRLKNVQFVQDLCRFLTKNQIVPIVCMVSPNLEQRENFKHDFNVIEFFVSCTEIRGREHFHVDYYEAPIENYTYIETSFKTEAESFLEIINKLEK